jgi:hypothetical protein
LISESDRKFVGNSSDDPHRTIITEVMGRFQQLPAARSEYKFKDIDWRWMDVTDPLQSTYAKILLKLFSPY